MNYKGITKGVGSRAVHSYLAGCGDNKSKAEPKTDTDASRETGKEEEAKDSASDKKVLRLAFSFHHYVSRRNGWRRRYYAERSSGCH